MNRLASEREPLQPILRAFGRGTKRSQLRALIVICPKGHTLIEVFPITARPVALWSRRELMTPWGERHEQ